MFLRILSIIIPVFSVIALGYFYGRRNRPDMGTVNRLNMNVLCPCLVFASLASKNFELGANHILIACSIAIVLGSGLLAWPFVRVLGADVRTFLPPMMFNNCGNLGIPLAVLAFGETGLSAMVALFTVSNLLHFTLGQYIVYRKANLKDLLRIPMIHVTWLGFAFALLKIPVPDALMIGIKMVGDATIPLMLFSLGVRMLDVSWAGWRLGVVGGIVCPMTGIVVALALAALLQLDPMQAGMLVLFGSLPPAVLNFIVAEHYGQEPEKVASIVLIGNLFSIVFVPLGLALALR
jgi:predicted permease